MAKPAFAPPVETPTHGPFFDVPVRGRPDFAEVPDHPDSNAGDHPDSHAFDHQPVHAGWLPPIDPPFDDTPVTPPLFDTPPVDLPDGFDLG